jgi:seryl-tRNA synthetase
LVLDVKYVREHTDEVRKALQNRRAEVDIDGFLQAEEKRRQATNEVEKLKARRNKASEEVAGRKRRGEDAEDLIAEVREINLGIKGFEDEIAGYEQITQKVLWEIPNIPHASVPIGTDENDNTELRRWGTVRKFDFTPLPHYEIGEKLGILDFARAAKVTGSRFTFLRGLGARLERALISYMLDLHTGKGYEEVLPPYLVHRHSMMGTGQLPKFEEDAFRVANTEYFLIPTAEVPVTNMYREEILDADILPIHHCAYSACFRAEAGAAGRDTRGLIRQHQFNKVELVKFALPEQSYQELETLTADAEAVLQGLELPYRVVCLSTGDLGFSSAKTYDLEVWLPGFDKYREISSCSNFEDFQARRADIRFRRGPKEKPEFVHTLNGSGVAIGRTVSAILENYQEADGSVRVPEVLISYMGGIKVIRS